jgi:hypothetical protein
VAVFLFLANSHPLTEIFQNGEKKGLFRFYSHQILKVNNNNNNSTDSILSSNILAKKYRKFP